jgi:uncharacterized RDD family membrane protein YckC
MTPEPAQSPPPGWYDDPRGPANQRYWDGTRWTEQTQPAPGTSGVAAEMWRRVIAIIIDWFLIFVGLFILGLLIGNTEIEDEGFQVGYENGWFFFGILVWLVYFSLFEGFWHRTPGKALLQIRVVDAEGRDPEWGPVILRNVMRIVDAFPYFIPYLLGFIVAMTNPERERLGDKAAKTRVVPREPTPPR